MTGRELFAHDNGPSKGVVVTVGTYRVRAIGRPANSRARLESFKYATSVRCAHDVVELFIDVLCLAFSVHGSHALGNFGVVAITIGHAPLETLA